MKQGKLHISALPGMMLVLTLAAATAQAKSSSGQSAGQPVKNYVVVLEDEPVAVWHRKRVTRANEFSIQSNGSKGKPGKALPMRPDFDSAETKDYLLELDEKFHNFEAEASLSIGRELKPVHRYRNAIHGFSAALNASEAARLSRLPQVKYVQADRLYKLHTDAGPNWIGADDIWNGLGALPNRRGEGIVIGVIDSGINWEHVSFSDPAGAGGGHNFVNPLGAQKGLCSDPEVMCNDKLIGVYDFVQDIPGTDIVEENTKGKDNSGHGTHVASIALGNPLQVTNNGIPMTISGVAPNANLISYRVCFLGDPNDSEDDSCSGSAIIQAIDQAIADQVDVINYSLGTDAFPPWDGATPQAMLNAWAAGIFIVTSSI